MSEFVGFFKMARTPTKAIKNHLICFLHSAFVSFVTRLFLTKNKRPKKYSLLSLSLVLLLRFSC